MKFLLEMLENHYRYQFVFDAGDLYSNGKQSKSVEKKLFWKLTKIFLIAQTRKLNMREALQYSPGPFPWALATDGGSLRETKKAALVNEIEKLASNRNRLHTKTYRLYHRCNSYHSET